MAYLDYNATTPLAPVAIAAMRTTLEQGFGNPSSIHAEGRAARAVIDDSREQIAAILGVRPHEIVFTSGGTESANLAVIGMARAAGSEKKHLITVETEHHCVLHACEFLKKNDGFALTVLPVDREGRVDPDAVRDAIRSDTALVTIMAANNETGVVQPLEAIAGHCARSGVRLHSDAVQWFGKRELRSDIEGLDALSLAAHKFYGPKGCGILVLKSGISIETLHHGGSHENSRRPGTENVAAIAGMAAAAAWASTGLTEEAGREAAMMERLWTGIRDICPEAVRNGLGADCLANTLNVSFPEADGEALLIGLDLEGVSVSSGSACMVGSMQPSHVLLAMGLPTDLASAAVRFSIGRFSTEADVDAALAGLERVLDRQAVMAGGLK